MSRRTANAKNRRTGGRFAMVPLATLNHPAVNTLQHATFRVLVLLAANYNGYNNGAIGITSTQAANAGIGSRHTLYSSLRELESRGLIAETYPASRVPPRPTMYSLAWLAVNDTDYSRATRCATHAYRNWRAAA